MPRIYESPQPAGNDRAVPVDAVAEHLRPQLAQVVADHPNTEKNVFIMMRFGDDELLASIHASLRKVLLALDLNPIRADDRDYTGDLHTNVELCMLASNWGIAVFEEMRGLSLDCNVALEFGYMFARRRRCLILRERRLAQLPVLLRHRVQYEFDMLDLESTIDESVTRWVRRDLRLNSE